MMQLRLLVAATPKSNGRPGPAGPGRCGAFVLTTHGVVTRPPRVSLSASRAHLCHHDWEMSIIDLTSRRRRRTAPITELADESLVSMITQGSSDAVAELSTRYRGRVENLGVQLLGDRGLAEEMTQETFTRLWRRANAYDPERGSVPTFVFTIARRVAVDIWRRPSSRRIDDPAVALPPPHHVDEITPLVTGLAVKQALGTLSESHRQIIELGYFRQLSQSEIAERLGLPLGTVKTRTYHALRALKEALADLDPSPPPVGLS
jgi:RNA polymerase sigma-70 factor, ECF subfamily